MDCIDLERLAEEPVAAEVTAANDNAPLAPRRPGRRAGLVRDIR